MSSPLRIVGLIPAAGTSRRMGRPKLTLPLGKLSMIQHVVVALEQGGCDEVVVIAGPVDQEGAVILANHARVEGALVLHVDVPTPDMRSTITFGLEALHAHALTPDAILLAPADCAALTPQIVQAVLRAQRTHPDRIIVPTHEGRRGHPLGLPWTLAEQIATLPPDQGVNALLKRHSSSVVELPIHYPGILTDVDTPEDYRRLVGN